jgi:anti-anti-sigma factor
MHDAEPYFDTAIEHGVLILTITRRQIEGEGLAQVLKEALLAAVARAKLTKVVLDLQHTRYVSSIAFWPLLALRRHLSDQNGRLILCGLTGAVHDVFTSTKMVSGSGTTTAPFEVAPDIDTAISRLRAPGVRILSSEI